MESTLKERFMTPAGWRTHSFVNPQTNHKIHYGSVFPKSDAPPSAIVVCLGGLSEFAEKYFEVAHDMLDRGFAFWFIDWHYQGRSGRLDKFPHRRHSDGFDKDVSDLHTFITDYVKPAAVHPEKGRIPLIMLAHSMGGNIGFHFLIKHPGLFDAAAFSAPFFGIYNFKLPMQLLATLIAPLVPFIGKYYVFGGADWNETSRLEKPVFSSDTYREKIHNYWSMKEPDIQVGSVTFGWVIQALKSCAALKKPGALSSIKIPVLIAVAGADQIIDNSILRRVAHDLPMGRLLEIEGARHEILMESDIHRNTFFEAFDKILEKHNIAKH
jgi:lysophospholipase